MEIKYTIEILTKDIQDIEKLVENLGKSKVASAIELDLALSKLRNVYEILTLIKTDRLHEMVPDTPVAEAEPAPAPVEEAEPEAEQAPAPEAETEAEPAPAPEAEPEAEPAPAPVEEAETGPESGPVPGPARSAVSTEKTDNSSILAEKFVTESSINENLAGKRGADLDKKLMGSPIDNISRNIGINDRFLIIRELFHGETEPFTVLVNALENAGNFESASIILKERMADHMEHQGVEILTGLLRRRYIR